MQTFLSLKYFTHVQTFNIILKVNKFRYFIMQIRNTNQVWLTNRSIFFFLVNPRKPVNVTNDKVMYAESSQRHIFWNYGQLGDSMMNDIMTNVKYCSVGEGCLTKTFSTSPASLTGLIANTTYSYTVYFVDTKYDKTSTMSNVMNFTTSERG